MATARAAVKAKLIGDSQLSTLLPGGVFLLDDFGPDGMTAKSIPRQANGVTVNPFAVIRFRAFSETASPKMGAERGNIEIYAYQFAGYSVIDLAMKRIKAVLHRARIAADDRNGFAFYFSHLSSELVDDELGNVPMMFIRFSVNQRR